MPKRARRQTKNRSRRAKRPQKHLFPAAAILIIAIAVVSAGIFVAHFFPVSAYLTYTCGNSICESWNGETMSNCYQDCGGGFCPDGTCEVWENSVSCPQDCGGGGGGGQVCGNNAIEGTEECDGTALGGATCISRGFTGGTLTCNPGCLFDTTGCTASACGNGLNETGEQCDDSNTDSGDGCSATCTRESGWTCTGGAEQLSVCGPTCGDAIIKGGEACDHANLGGEDCASQGFTGGTLACKSDCTGFVTSGCTAAAECGNSVIDTGESCDGATLGGADCISQGYTGGTLACAANCLFDTSGCTAEPTTECGNAIIEEGEDCDLTKLGGKTCKLMDFTGGTLKCADDCTFDTSACTVEVVITSEQALNSITGATTEVSSARKEGKDVTEATALLSEAIMAYNAADYKIAKNKADMAKLTALTAEVPEKPAELPLVYIILGILILAGGGGLYYANKKGLLKNLKPQGGKAPPAPSAPETPSTPGGVVTQMCRRK